MRVFPITLVVSTLETSVLWSFGLAQKIWPAHPILAIIPIAGVSWIVIQAHLSQHGRGERGKSRL